MSQEQHAWQVNSVDIHGIQHAERWTNSEEHAFTVARETLAKDDVIKVTIEKDYP